MDNPVTTAAQRGSAKTARIPIKVLAAPTLTKPGWVRVGTATFMVLGELCTRRCPFCAVAHGRPCAADPEEPLKLAPTVARPRLKHVVITSVDRDDLSDGGAAHLAACIRAVRQQSPATCIETLTPDLRGRLAVAIDVLTSTPPDGLNHNLETVPRLYRWGWVKPTTKSSP